MADGSNADGLSAIGQLIEDSIGADSQQIQTTEFSPQRIAGERVTLEQAKRILDRVDQRPVQLEQVAAGSPGDNDSRQ